MSAAAVNPKPANVTPTFSILPTDPSLVIFSFLNAADLKVTAAVSSSFKALSSDDEVWHAAAKKRYPHLADSAKQPHKSWKETYLALEASSRARAARASAVVQTHVRKVEIDNLHHRTQNAAAAILGFAAPAANTHYVPVGAPSMWMGRKIVVYKTTTQG